MGVRARGLRAMNGEALEYNACFTVGSSTEARGGAFSGEARAKAGMAQRSEGRCICGASGGVCSAPERALCASASSEAGSLGGRSSGACDSTKRLCGPRAWMAHTGRASGGGGESSCCRRGGDLYSLVCGKVWKLTSALPQG